MELFLIISSETRIVEKSLIRVSIELKSKSLFQGFSCRLILLNNHCVCLGNLKPGSSVGEENSKICSG
jgi:hypothetical protein